MRNILVTGGAGNVGGSLAKNLVADPENFVVVLDDLSTGSMSKLPDANRFSNFRFIKGDVNSYSDVSSVILRYGFDYIFNYAAVVGVKRTLENPAKVLNDIQGIKNCIRDCKKIWV